jgi:hypothetical protein
MTFEYEYNTQDAELWQENIMDLTLESKLINKELSVILCSSTLLQWHITLHTLISIFNAALFTTAPNLNTLNSRLSGGELTSLQLNRGFF